MKKIVFMISFLLLIGVFASSMSVMAAENRSYVYNEYAETVSAPSGYTFTKIILGSQLGIGDFNSPEDVFVDENNIYISDSGNNRIVVLNKDYTLSNIIDTVIYKDEAQALSKPSGVYTRDDLVYICDMGNSRAIAINKNGVVRRIFERPETELLADDFEFMPSKITVNSAGTVFIVTYGVYQGLLQYGNTDEFVGFFGANKVQVTPSVVLQNMWKSIFSEEQRNSLIRSIPTEYANIYIDDEDMIYTATSTAETEQIKKLNAAGENILMYPGSSGGLLKKGYDRSKFGDQQINSIKGERQTSIINDINVDDEEIIAVLDNRRGRVFVYDNEQNLLTIFGGTGDQKGYFKNAVSLDKCDNAYLVVDKQKNSITVFEPTEYMNNIRLALSSYKSGEYKESLNYWEKVIEKNSGLSVAYRGVGIAKYLNGDSKDAMKYLKMGDDRYYYSMALQQYRREYISDNFWWIIILAIVVIILAVYLLKQLKKAIIKSGEKRGLITK